MSRIRKKHGILSYVCVRALECAPHAVIGNELLNDVDSASMPKMISRRRLAMSASEFPQRKSHRSIAFEVIPRLRVEVSKVDNHSRSVTNKGFFTLSCRSILMLRRCSILQDAALATDMETSNDIDPAMRVTSTGEFSSCTGCQMHFLFILVVL